MPGAMRPAHPWERDECGMTNQVELAMEWGCGFPPHQGMQQRRLLLFPRRAGGGVGGMQWRTARRPTDGSRLGDAGSERRPTLGESLASILHGCDEMMESGTAKRGCQRTPT